MAGGRVECGDDDRVRAQTAAPGTGIAAGEQNRDPVDTLGVDRRYQVDGRDRFRDDVGPGRDRNGISDAGPEDQSSSSIAA